MTNALSPNKRVQSTLISSTSYFTDVYSESGFFVTHASSTTDDPRGKASYTSNPISRKSFIVSFVTEPREKLSMPMFEPYTEYAREITSFLSVLFGKRFDCHGLCQCEGLLHLPSIEPYQELVDHRLRHNNHKPRRDIMIPLKLSEIRRIAPLFREIDYDADRREILRVASRFYMNGLQQFESQPETAYLLFVTVGEILAKTCHLDRDDMLDAEAMQVLNFLQQENAPKRIVNIFKSKMYQVKKRYVATLLRLVKDSFFIEDDDSKKWNRICKSDLEDKLKASYDLRSKWVHHGMKFKGVLTHAGRGWEALGGDPSRCKTDYQKLACRAPTLEGMERLMRFAILSRMQEIGLDIDDSLSESFHTLNDGTDSRNSLQEQNIE